MSEIQDAVQIIKVALDGAEIILKVGKMNFDFVKSVCALFARMMEQEKLEGKTSVRRLLKSGGDLQVFKFRTEDLYAVKKMADKYGILYSILPDINQKDGMSQILFHSQAVPRIQAIMEQIQGAGIESMDDYFSNAEPKALDTLTQEAKKKYGNMGHRYSGEAEIFSGAPVENEISAKKMEEIRNFQKGYIENPKINGITIARKMVMEETEREIKTRIPYRQNEYIWLPKSEITWINHDKTIYAGLEKEWEYQIVDEADRPIRQVSGQELYKQSYDPVNHSLNGREQERIRKRQRQEQQDKIRQDKEVRDKGLQNRPPRNPQQSGNTRKRNARKKEERKPVRPSHSGISNGPAMPPQGRRGR